MSPDWAHDSYDKIATRLEEALGGDEAAFRALRSVPWAVTEKIHGANFCVASDGRQLRFAKRKAWLLPGEDFFDHRRALAGIEDALLALGARLGGARTLVYGELFGGSYPHPDTAPVAGASPVQTGVSYAPDIRFLAFDVAVVGSDGARRWLPLDEARGALSDLGIGAVPLLLRGSYAEAVAYPLGGDSRVPALLGLPPLPEGSNAAEGVVLTPERPVAVRGRSEPIRPVLKRKIPAFEEDARFHGAKPPPRPPTAGAGALEALCAEASELVCGPRVAAAVSKVGRLTDEARAAEVVALVVEDVFEALGQTMPALLAALAPAERASLASFVRGEADALVALQQGR